MQAGTPSPAAVIKTTALVLLVIAAGLLTALIVIHIRTALIWAFTAIFMTLALHSAVDWVERWHIGRFHPPRWIAVLLVFGMVTVVFIAILLLVIPPLIREVEALAPKLPGYIQDFENWAEHNEKFRTLNNKYHLTENLSMQAQELPGKLGGAASEVEAITLRLIQHVVAGITIFFLTFFLLLDGRQQAERLISQFSEAHAVRMRRIGARIAGVVRRYVSINLSLAVLAGVLTWLALELLGLRDAVPLGIVMGFMTLIPLVGLTIGGVLIAIPVAIHSFPTGLIIWAVIFLIYQQMQDRVLQPMLYKRGVIIGGELVGVLGALLAIPTAASIGVLIDEWAIWRREAREAAEAAQLEIGEGTEPA
jgi:predicted PurR-regulated permease PerM